MGRPRLIERSEDPIHRKKTSTTKRTLRPRRGRKNDENGKFDPNDFPMEKVPSDLHPFVVEKMTYLEFAEFNLCSLLSSEMCHSLPETTQLPLNVDTINFRFRAVNLNEEDDLMSSPEKLEQCFPKNVHYFCQKLCINPEYWDIIKEYRLTVERIEIYDGEVTAPFVKNILKHTKATVLDCDHLDNTALSLPEMKQLKSVTFASSDLTDEILLNLPIPSMEIKYCELKKPVFKQIILEWINGEREIDNIELEMHYELQLKDLINEMKSEKSISIYKENPKRRQFVLCRQLGEEEDYLKVSQETNMFTAVYSQKS